MLSGIQQQVLRPEVIEYTLAKFEDELLKAVDDLGGDLQQMRLRKAELDREVANLANPVAGGDFSPALRAALVEREREIADITAKIFDAKPDSASSKMSNIRRLVEQRMKALASVLNSDAQSVRAELAKHIDEIKMTPDGEHYVASGTWDLLGCGRYGGAGGQNRTVGPSQQFTFNLVA